MRGESAGQPAFRGVLPGNVKRVTEPGLQTDSLTCRQRQVLVQVPCGGQT
jgi:hypothetical protein